ncbi:MAG: hypothetical protein ABIP06_09385 [Pyrinomonadaceae bacterium]
MKKIIFSLVFGLFACISIVSAQPRPIEKTSTTAKQTANRTMLSSVEARYEGGMFGYSEREKGTIKFDDDNERLVFFGRENGKELFSIPYKALLVVAPTGRKVQSGAGTAVGSAPILGAGIIGSMMKKKKNYLTIQFRDLDVEVQGTTSFLIDTDELLEQVVYSLGEKAKMTQRGDAYYRQSERKTTL